MVTVRSFRRGSTSHDRRRLEAVIGELLVDVVGEDPDIGVLQQHVADRPQLFALNRRRRSGCRGCSA